MSLDLNDVVGVTMFSRFQGQRILNVFHYKWLGASGADYNLEVDQLCGAFRTNVWRGGVTPWRGAVTSDFKVEFFRAQKVAPTRDVYWQRNATADDVGQEGPPSAPSDTNITISLRTLSVIRGTTGNKKITGLASSRLVGNLWSDATVNTFQDMSAQFTILLPDSAAVLNWQPVVWSPKRRFDRRNVVGCTARFEVRVLRLREYGKGV